MYTRCNGCHTVHPLNAALLAQGAGKYRCGKCNKLNNALESLFDEWPNAGQSAPAQAGTPSLGIRLDVSSQKPEGDSDEEELSGNSDKAGRKKFSQLAWISTAFVLLIVTGLNLAWFFRAPLISERLAQWGMIEVQSPIPARDIEQLRLVSSDLRSHPSQAGALRLNATILNQADDRRAYPKLEVLLLDSSGQAMSGRLFEPTEYLAEDADIASGMTSQAYLPVVLDLSDPGQQAVGFEVRIR